MNELEKNIFAQIEKDRDYLIELRRWFHMHPELAAQEFLTREKIENELDRLSIPHRPAATTGVYCEIEGTRSGPGKTIVLRADIDALPVTETNPVPYASLFSGKMHACGHDAHTAALIGAARVLNANRDKFSGKVIFTWQPGEEIGYGARIIVDSGMIDGADRTFGLHVASNVPVGKVVLMAGPNNAAVDWFKISVHGLGAHVSTPHRGVDAAFIASQIVVSAQALISRRTDPMDNAVIGIGKITAGTAYNVVAQSAEIEGTVRTLIPETRERIKGELSALADSVASMYGGAAEIEWKDFTSPLINDEKAAREAQKTAVSLLGEENVITQRKPSLGGDDFAEYILKVPGVYAYVGSADPDVPSTTVSHHNSRFDISENCLTIAAALYSLYAIEFLNGEV